MKPETKYNLLLSLTLVIGFGGFIVIALLVLPTMSKGGFLGPALIAIWAILISLLLYLRYRIAKNDAEIQAQIKKDAAKHTRQQAKRAARKGLLRRRIESPFTDLSDDDDDEEEETPKLPEKKE